MTALLSSPRAGGDRSALPTDHRPAATLGWAVIAIAFGGLALWSALAPLSSAAIAPGTVVVDSNRKEIAHLDGGVVREILVRDGDRVRSGQVLVRFDATQARARLNLLQGRHDADRAYEARLLAERDHLTAIAFPEDLLARAATNEEVRQILQGQQRLFEARRNALFGEIAILENRIEQSNVQIGGLETQAAAKERQAALVQRELAGVQTLRAKGHASATRVAALEREAERLKGERGRIIAEIAQVRQAIGEARLQIAQAEKSFAEQVEEDLRDVRARLFDTAEQIHAARDVLARLEIRAPTAGTVVDLAVHTKGGVIAPGGRIMDIVPGNDRLVIDARVRPDDIDDLAVGAQADIRFTAFDQYATPVVSGSVNRISADRLIDPKTNLPYFLVRVAIDEKGREQLKGRDLVPGMAAEVIIRKADRTVLGYLLGPLRDLLLKSFRE